VAVTSEGVLAVISLKSGVTLWRHIFDSSNILIIYTYYIYLLYTYYIYSYYYSLYIYTCVLNLIYLLTALSYILYIVYNKYIL
jgi:hypothetical protein